MDGITTTITYHLFGPGIDEPLASSRSAATVHYATDGLGSVILATDATGTPQDSYAYDAWGVSRASSETFAQPFRYTAREAGDGPDLLFYRARFLNASAGRFLMARRVRSRSWRGSCCGSWGCELA